MTTHKFIPIYQSKSSDETKLLEDRIKIFNNHCFPEKDDLNVEVKRQIERATATTILDSTILNILNYLEDKFASLIFTSEGIDGNTRKLHITNHSYGVSIRLDDINYSIFYSTIK